MPRVTDAHRRSRRDEIAEAAVRVLQRRGVGSTSIASIVEESGLSAGAIYANFENKSDLARYIAQDLLDWRVELLGRQRPGDAAVAPLDLLRELLESMDRDAPPLAVLLQFWGEATMDPELHAVLETKVGELRDALERAVRPWAEQRAPERVDDAARAAAVTLVTLAQGYLSNRALLGWISIDEYLDGIAVIA